MAAIPPQYRAQLEQMLSTIDQKLLQFPQARTVQQKTNVRPSLLAIGGVLFFVIFVVFGIGGKFIGNLIGFLYPLYASFRSLKYPQQGDQHTQWLTYWVVYSLFTLIESLTDFFLYWIPMYHLAKICFLVWCFLPSTQGARIIYETIVNPLLSKYEGDIDRTASSARAHAAKISQDFVTDAADAITKSNSNSNSSSNNYNQKLAHEAVNQLLNNNSFSSASSMMSGHGGPDVEAPKRN